MVFVLWNSLLDELRRDLLGLDPNGSLKAIDWSWRILWWPNWGNWGTGLFHAASPSKILKDLFGIRRSSTALSALLGRWCLRAGVDGAEEYRGGEVLGTLGVSMDVPGLAVA